MRHLAFAAALMLSSMTAAPVLAQAPATPASGLSVSEVSAWLTRIGGQVGPLQRVDGQTFFSVTNAGLTWAVFFYGCREDVCDSVQFSAVVPGAGATPEAVNAWNRDNRFLKAFRTAGETPSATAQYDVVALPGAGVEQLTDPLSVWLQLLPKFATAMGYGAE